MVEIFTSLDDEDQESVPANQPISEDQIEIVQV